MLAQMRCLRFTGNLETHVFWDGIMAMKKFFFPYGSSCIWNGMAIRFCEYKLLGNATLCDQYHVLYNTVQHKGDTIAKALESSPSNMPFIRSLIGPRQALWNGLLQRLDSVQSTHGSNVFRWNLT
jgi:hypothetical protein